MRTRHERDWYVPEGAALHDTGDADLEVHTYTTRRDKPGAIAFYGKAKKPTWHYIFRTEERRAEKIAESIESRRLHHEAKAKRAEERKKPHDLKVGDILTGSWGYDQTNVDWVEVVEVPGPRTVIIREIGASVGGVDNEFRGADMMTAIPGSFKGPRMKKVVNDGSIKLSSWGRYCSKWGGEAKYQTAWGYGH